MDLEIIKRIEEIIRAEFPNVTKVVGNVERNKVGKTKIAFVLHTEQKIWKLLFPEGIEEELALTALRRKIKGLPMDEVMEEIRLKYRDGNSPKFYSHNN